MKESSKMEKSKEKERLSIIMASFSKEILKMEKKQMDFATVLTASLYL